MKKEILSSEPRLALLAHAPENELRGGIKTVVQHLKLTFPQLEIFPRPEWVSQHPLLKLEFKTWYLNCLKNDLIFARFFLKLHKKKPFDLFFTYSCTGLYLTAKRLGIPVIHICLGCFTNFINQTLRSRLEIVSQKAIVSTMDKKSGRGKYRTVTSEQIKNEIKEAYGYDSRLIPVGIDLNHFYPQDKQTARRFMGLAENTPMGLYVGRAEFAKGWDILIEVAKALRHVTFICLTDIKNSIPLDNVIIKKNSSHDELKQYYNSADFFLLPSRYESASIVTLEAMSCNLPIIISDSVWKVLFNKNNHLGPIEGTYRVCEGVEGYIQAIQECLKTTELAQTRRFVEKHHSLHQFCEEYQKLVKKLLHHDFDFGTIK